MAEHGSNSTAVINMEDFEKIVDNKIDSRCTTSGTSNCGHIPSSTYEVQQLIREVCKSDYEPLVVSIGPYHHGKEQLHDMEKVKWNCLDYMLKSNTEKNLHDYIKALWKLYPAVKEFYGGGVRIESTKLIHLLLIDGCFIIASICGADWIASKPNSSLEENLSRQMETLEYRIVVRDLLLVENQVPFIVLTTIYELFLGKEDTRTSLPEKLAIFVEEILCGNPISIKELNRPREFYHLLHLCHMYIKPCINGNPGAVKQGYSTSNLLVQWHQAVQYHLAGIKLEKREFNKNNPHCLLEVRFTGDVLQIPHIFIDELTTTIFRSLIALEYTNPQYGNHIAAYITFMSQLVSSTEDVALLVSKEIIRHHFESDQEVLNIFTSLGECVVFDFSSNYYLKSIFQNLEEHYLSRMKWGIGWIYRARSAIGIWT